MMKALLIPLIAFLLLSNRATADVPEPVLFLDFESPPRGASHHGIANSKGLREPRVHPEAARLDEALEGAWSFTVTGWIKRKMNPLDADMSAECIVNLPGRFRVFCDGTYRWRLFLDISKTGQDQPTRVGSSWLADFSPDDRWVFFAVTYDGTKSEKNYGIYCGWEQYGVKEDALGNTPGGQLNAEAGGPLIIGASKADGVERFKGMIDNIRVYATRKQSGECAFDWQQLDGIRRADLGPEWIGLLSARSKLLAQAEQEKLHLTEHAHWKLPTVVHPVDTLERIFPDRPPTPARSEPVSVPRGGTAHVLFAGHSRSETPESYRIEVTPIKDSEDRELLGEVTVYELINVPVEANNNGGSRTSVTLKPPRMWMEDFIREAPFEVAEALKEADSIDLGGKSTPYQGILLSAKVSPDAKPGIYRGRLILQAENIGASAPFSIQVHKTRVPAEPVLSTHYWLSPDPRDLSSGTPPEWWSEEHWKLLESSGRTLREYGQDVLWTPLIDGKDPLIRTTLETDGSYSFDFSRFDRWMDTFLRLGFERMAGHHLVNLPGGRGISVLDQASGAEKLMFPLPAQEKEWIRFSTVFLDVLAAHLRAKGWIDRYIQHLYDEPRDFEKYRTLSNVFRTYMPGVKSIDAIKTKPEYSPLVDIQVFDIFMIYPHAQRLVADRKSRGQENWLYHCCSPYPPYPNRHLDERLSDSRLYPWLCYLMNADGYLYWAANMNRGADPYMTSVGPVPGGSQNPGHPPGDNWMFYPGPDGLRGSMRMVAFRDGLLDHTLLSMLAARDKSKADEIMRRVAEDTVHYAKEPGVFHAARKALLRALDGD